MGSGKSKQNNKSETSSYPAIYGPPTKPVLIYPSARAGTGGSTTAYAATNNLQTSEVQQQDTQGLSSNVKGRIYPNLATTTQPINKIEDLYPIQPAERPIPSAPPAYTVKKNKRKPNTKFKIPCSNANVGCKVYIKRVDFDNHLKECPATERPCPLQSMGKAACHWRGNLYDVGAHFDFAHPTNRAADVDKEMIISNFSVFVEAKNHFIYLITVGTFNFLAHVSIDSDNILFGVQCCSSDMSAKKWTYEFHVYNKQHPRKKYIYTDTCISYHLPLVDMFQNCAVLPLSYVKGFINLDTFTYKIYIKRVGQPGEDRSRFPDMSNQNIE